MNTQQQLSNIARNIVQGILDQKKAQGVVGYVLTGDDIRGALGQATEIPFLKAIVTSDMILAVEAELLNSFTTDGGEFDILVDDTDHVPWLTADRKGGMKWGYWNRYAEYMMSVEKKPATVVKTIDDVTERILGRIEDPARVGGWSVRGLVVGSVQSGKTANYVGLINKAIDSGYKLIVIMAGVHSTLRRQTQIRIDESVTGVDSRKKADHPQGRSFGVGSIDRNVRTIHMLTSAKSDFSRQVGESSGVQVGGDPIILVIKKNRSILRNLQEWLMAVGSRPKPGQPEDGERWIPGCPALIIDDEADNASINTSKEGRSSINKAIVGLLTSLEKAAYVGYTATPYANLFADINDQENIYPRNFIVNIKPPGNYLGVERVFGIDPDGEVGIEAKEPLPIVEEIDTFAEFIPPKHRMDFVPKDLPPCLIKAIKVFVLGTAAKNFRLSKGVRLQKHSSMLVHVSHFKAVINKFSDLVRALKDQLRDDASVGDQAIFDDFEKVWDAEFAETFADFDEADQGMPVSWSDIRPLLKPTLDAVQVRAIHGESQVSLDYDECKDGLIVIAVGGNKLSRGLTLESLIVSYYLRTTKLYDTLMQMGRWFGYRDGYVDLCRVYTTRQLINWYSHIALADHELRLEFDRLCESGRKPSEYGLKVRAHPDGMKITAMSRMRFATMCDITYAGKLVQTTVMSVKKPEVAENMLTTSEFFSSLGAGRSHANYPNYTYYPSVPSKAVCDYVSKMHIPPGANRFVKQLIVSFIEKQATFATSWNVVFAPLGMSTSESALGVAFDFNGKKVKAISRKVEAPKKSRPVRELIDDYSPVKHNLLSPDDQGADLHFTNLSPDLIRDYYGKSGLYSYMGLLEEYEKRGMSLYRAALELTRVKMGPNKKGELPVVPSGEFCRLLRPEGQALLLVYPVTPLLDRDKVVSAKGKHSWSSEPAPLDHPLIGVAMSFSASDKVVPVRYAVDDTFRAQIFGGDPDQGWDDEEERRHRLMNRFTMTTENKNIFTKFRADAAVANPRPASIVNRVHPTPRCCLEYRLDVGENKAYLVAYCPGNLLPSQARWPKLKAFEIRQRSVLGRDCIAVSVLPSVPQADIALAEEMLSLVGSNCQPGLDPGEAVEDMLTCLARMQSLAKGRGQPLSPEKQVGLFGELHVIANLLMPAQGAEKTIAEWVGPSGAPQDFQSKGCAMEIKTTRGNLPQTIKISSARQLQGDTVARIFLVRIALDSQPSVGASLTEMVNQISSALASNSLVAMSFRDKLAEVGYHEEHAKLYEEPKYQIRSVVFYDVRDGFPRIQEKDLPVGIGELHYEIETSACAGYVVDESEVKKSFA